MLRLIRRGGSSGQSQAGPALDFMEILSIRRGRSNRLVKLEFMKILGYNIKNFVISPTPIAEFHLPPLSGFLCQCNV